MKATAGILFLVIVTVFLYVNAEPLPRKTTTTTKPKRSSPRSLPSNKKVKGTTTALTTTTTSTTSTENVTFTTTELLTTTTTTTTTLPPSTTTTRVTTTSRPKTTTIPQIPTAVLVMTYRSKNKTKAVGTSGVEYADDDLTQESSKVTRVSDSRSVNKSIKSVSANHDLNHFVNISDKSKCIGKTCSGKQTLQDFSSPPLTVAEATIVGVSIALGALVLTATCIYVYVSTERLKIQPQKRCLGSTS